MLSGCRDAVVGLELDGRNEADLAVQAVLLGSALEAGP